MKRAVRSQSMVIATAIVLLGLPDNAASELLSEDSSFGTGTITLDTDTGIRWLDVTESTPYSYDQVLVQLQPGGIFEGYRLATDSDVLTMWQHAGVDTGPGFLSTWTTQNFQPIVDLMAMVGVTGLNAGNLGGGNYFDYTVGHIESGPGGGGAWVETASLGADPDPTVTAKPSIGGTVPSTNSNSRHGSWLIRGSIPNPWSELISEDSLFGPDTITLDTNTGLRWLDPTVSTAYSYDQLVAELLPGGVFHGYRLATQGEVLALWDSVGINTGFGYLNTFTTENFQPIVDLMSFVGVTRYDGGDMGGNNYYDVSSGYIESGPGGGVVLLAQMGADPDPTQTARPNFASSASTNTSTTHGAWLVRGFRPNAWTELISEDSAFGPDTVTLDTNTGMRWLDVTESTSYSYDALLPELLPGGVFDGYRLATEAEVLQLWKNAGINTTPGVLETWTTQNYDPVVSLMAFVGLPGPDAGNAGGGNFYDISAGRIESGPGGGSATVLTLGADPDPTGMAYGIIGIIPSDDITSFQGAWLVRGTGFLGQPSRVAGLPDINGNGSPDVAVLTDDAGVTVQIRDGASDALINDIDFGSDPAVRMAVVDDLNFNGKPEIAVLGTRPDSNTRVQVKDSLTGDGINNIFYGTAYSPVDLAVVPDSDSNGADELLVVGASASDGVRAQARDALSDAATCTVFYGNLAVPQDVLALTDISGNSEPEVIVHGQVTTSSQGRAQMRDSDTREMMRNFFFGSVYLPLELAMINDVSGDGIPDMAQLAIRYDTGAVRVQVRNSVTGDKISNGFIGTVDLPIALVGILDANSNGSPDVAILVQRPDGSAKIIVRDGATGAFISNIFMGAITNPVAMSLVDDLNMNGTDELAVLGENTAGGTRVQVKDSISGVQVNTIEYP